MGLYSEFLDTRMSFEDISLERKKLLKEISSLRNGRDVIVYAADFSKSGAPISISYDDLVPFYDQLSNLNGSELDLILETPGGSGEVAEDIVRTLRNKYQNISVIIPGWAKSAGTIIAMASDDILMDSNSALGPIDAQLSYQGKSFSADALIKGFEKIKNEVEQKNYLNPAYIPILQGISPGELENAQNALDFAKNLVTDWLVTYKFKDWNIHSTSGIEVTEEEKIQRAEEIASELCNHEKWKTHGKSIRITDLEKMKLKIRNIEEEPELHNAIQKYRALLSMTFATNIYKVIETGESQIYRSINSNMAAAPTRITPNDRKFIFVDINCGKCRQKHEIQINLEDNQPIQRGKKRINPDGTFICEHCGNNLELSKLINDIQSQNNKKVIL